MTTTPHRRARSAPGSDRLASAGKWAHGQVVRQAARGVLEDIVESADVQAQQAGRQLRCILELWSLARADRGIEWVAAAGETTFQTDERIRALLATEDQVVLDVADEIGAALRLPFGAAIARVREALVLGVQLPEVLGDLEAGRFSARHATVMADQWRELVEDLPPGDKAPPEAVRRLVAELRERAPHCTVAQLKAFARRRRTIKLQDTQERRHRHAWARRRVWLEHGEDGMACLHAVLDAATAVAAQDRLDALVARLGRETGSYPAAPGALSDMEAAPRTEAQLRADVLADILLAGEVPDDPSFPRDVRGQVSVTVPVLTLLERAAGPGADRTCLETLLNARTAGITDLAELAGRMDPAQLAELARRTTGDVGAPAGPTGRARPRGSPGSSGPARRTAVHSDAPILSGHGPISAEVARRLAGDAPSWHRILTHPVTGSVLDHDRTTYAVPADLRRRLQWRDETCRFPGCRRRAERCDLDHTVAWQDGGRTAADNLAHLCRHHHLVKHRAGPLGRWSVRQLGPSPSGGVLEWTSPAGRTYRTVPDALAATDAVLRGGVTRASTAPPDVPSAREFEARATAPGNTPASPSTSSSATAPAEDPPPF